MRYLVGALCAVAILFAASANVAAAATVGCGRVTTFVAPDSAAAVFATHNGDGWVIFARSDGTSDKVIIRAGTQVGALSGYVCMGIDSLYFTGQLTPGMAGYVPEPSVVVPQGTAIYCGVVAANSITFGQGAGPRTYELRVTSGPGGGGRFGVSDALPLPTIGSYVCGRFEQGVPMTGLLAWIGPSDPGYVVSTLPSTSTLPDPGAGVGIWLLVTGLAALAGVGVHRARARRSFATH